MSGEDSLTFGHREVWACGRWFWGPVTGARSAEHLGTHRTAPGCRACPVRPPSGPCLSASTARASRDDCSHGWEAGRQRPSWSPARPSPSSAEQPGI